ncbi:MAG: DegV family protein [Chloroflexota bacterium]
MAIRIVTDSTADLTPALAAELGVAVVPLTVFFGQEAFLDGVEMGHDEFFRRLTSSKELPHTSQPSVGDFLKAYQPLVEAGDAVVSIHISDKLSGTLNSARAAVKELPEGAQVRLVDTRLTCMGQALVVRAASQAAASGASLNEVVAVAEQASADTELYFVLDTLEYLAKGGRIGKAQALVGGLLGIKPVLKLVDGEVHPHEKVRTRAKALARMLDIARQGAPYAEIALIHEARGTDVDAFAAALQEMTPAPVLKGIIGAVIGTYAGPNVIGVALRRKRN